MLPSKEAFIRVSGDRATMYPLVVVLGINIGVVATKLITGISFGLFHPQETNLTFSLITLNNMTYLLTIVNLINLARTYKNK